MLKANARKRRHITALSKGQSRIRIRDKNQVGEGVVKDALTRLYAMITNKDPYDVGVDKKKEKDIYDTIYREQEQGEREKRARQRELKRKADEERRALFDKLSFGSGCCCEDYYEIQKGSGLFDWLSEKVINPAVEKTQYIFTKNRFGKRYADAQNKSIKRLLKKDPMFIYKKMTDPDYWESAFKKTHEFLKNDKIMKDLKGPIGDALGAIPVVGSDIKDGWKKLTKKDAKETDLKGTLDKMAKRLQKEEKTFKKYGINPPPLAIGFASAKEYKKALDEYTNKNRDVLIKMGRLEQGGQGMRGGASAYWTCANTAPSCKKLYKGMKEYHACARKKGCRNREISRAEADKRFLEIEEEAKRSNEPVEIVAPSRRRRRRR